MIKEAITQYRATADKFIGLLNSVATQQFNTVPFAGSWTPAQVGDHIYRSIDRTPELITAPGIATGRNAGEKEDAIKKVFLDFDARYNSPEYILPSNDPLDKSELINKLGFKSSAVISAIESTDPTEECPGFEVPGFGPFTRLEWLYLVTYHTQRHIHQLENMVTSL